MMMRMLVRASREPDSTEPDSIGRRATHRSGSAWHDAGSEDEVEPAREEYT